MGKQRHDIGVQKRLLARRREQMAYPNADRLARSLVARGLASGAIIHDLQTGKHKPQAIQDGGKTND